jgi:hypothetical protein
LARCTIKHGSRFGMRGQICSVMTNSIPTVGCRNDGAIFDNRGTGCVLSILASTEEAYSLLIYLTYCLGDRPEPALQQKA